MPAEDSKNKSAKAYLKYSGLAVQMGLTIAAFAYGGQYMDNHYQTPRPYFTAAFCLAGVAIAMYMVFKDLLTDNDA